MFDFKVVEKDLGFVKPNSQHTVNFEFTGGTKHDILQVSPSCACMAQFSLLDNKIQFNFTENTYKSKSKGDLQFIKEAKGVLNFRKAVTVHIKPPSKESNFILDPTTGEKIESSKALSFILHIKGTIDLNKDYGL